MISGRLTYMIALILSITWDRGIMTNPVRKFPLHTVNSCPGNRTEWERASRRLNCTMQPDVFENRYHCVATRDRSRLMEFCYPLSRSLFGKGQCVIFDPPSTLDNYTCLHFTDGCPDDHYYTDKLYKYPNCFRIEPALKCFISDESCLRRNRITTMQTEVKSTSQTFIVQNITTQEQDKIDLVPVLVPTFVLLGFLFGIVTFVMLRLKRLGRRLWTTNRLKKSVQSVNDDVTESLLEKNAKKTDPIETHDAEDQSQRGDENAITEKNVSHRDNENKVPLCDKPYQYEMKMTENLNNTETREINEHDECKKENENLKAEKYGCQHDNENTDKTRDTQFLEGRRYFGKKLRLKIDKGSKILQDFKETISELFVETTAYKNVFCALQKHRCVLVKGNPGDGKTTIAKHVLLELEQKGMEPVEIYSIKDIDSIPIYSKIAVFIDNLFGERSVSKEELFKFKGRENGIKAFLSNDEEKNGNVFIATIRNDIYKECAERLESNKFFISSVIDISNAENQINREEFEQFVDKYGLKQLVPDMEHLDIHNFGCSIGIPQCFRLLKSKLGSNLDVHNLFVHPSNFLRKEIEQRIIEKEPKTAVLIYVLLCGGSISKDTLSSPEKDQAMKYKALNIIGMEENIDSLKKFHNSKGWFEGLYMMYDDIEQTYRFSHSTVQESLFLYICQYHPKDIISTCDPSLLVSLTASNTSTDSVASKTSKDNVVSSKSEDTVAINVKMFLDLINRIRILITNKHASAFKSISLLKLWSNNEFTESVMKNTECVEAMRKYVDENGDSMLVHFAEAGNVKMVSFLFHKLSDEERYKSLNKARLHDHKTILRQKLFSTPFFLRIFFISQL